MKGFIRERGSSFTAYWETRDPATGARRQHSKGGFAKKAGAQSHLNVVVGKVTTGEWRADQPLTVRDLLVEHWLPAQRARELRPATLAQYEGVVEHWILPKLGGTKVAALTPAAVVDFMAALRSEPTAKGRKGLSARSTQLAAGVLKAACAFAVSTEMIGRNPIAGVRRPRAEGQAMRVWSADEARAFLHATGGDRLAFAWALLLTRGLRRGELCGLKWSAVDPVAGTLRIESTLITVEGQPVASRPKTQAGLRSISLDAQLVALLRAHRKRQRTEQVAAGPAYEHGGYLLADELGRPYHPDTISGWFEARVAETGLPRIRLHDCRHTALSLMLAAGVPVKVVSEIAGHASPTITLSVYAHVMPGMAEEAGAALSASLLG